MITFLGGKRGILTRSMFSVSTGVVNIFNRIRENAGAEQGKFHNLGTFGLNFLPPLLQNKNWKYLLDSFLLQYSALTV